jgi:hypothetical protein
MCPDITKKTGVLTANERRVMEPRQLFKRKKNHVSLVYSSFSSAPGLSGAAGERIRSKTTLQYHARRAVVHVRPKRRLRRALEQTRQAEVVMAVAASHACPTLVFSLLRLSTCHRQPLKRLKRQYCTVYSIIFRHSALHILRGSASSTLAYAVAASMAYSNSSNRIQGHPGLRLSSHACTNKSGAVVSEQDNAPGIFDRRDHLHQ